MALDKYRYIYYGNRTYCYDWQILYRYENGKYIKKKCIIEWGDSIVDRISYAKTTIDDKDTLLYRQDGGKIYCRTKNGEELIINFDLEVGETFINPEGKKYVVQSKEVCNNPIVGANGTSSNEDERPMQLNLVAEDGSEDEWIEGIGSLKWGILPPYMFLEIGDYDTPEWSSILRVRNVNVGATSEVNEDAYKLIFFPIKDYYEYPEYYNEHKEELGFSFIGDTLLIQGVMKLNNLRSYAECVFDGNVVDVGIHQYINPLLYPTGLAYRYFEAKVPGFKAGTYIVNGQTLVCKGKNPDEDYHPFVEEGKKWECTISWGLLETNIKKEYYSISGDTIVNGITCKKLHGPYSTYAVYEKDGKVYCHEKVNGDFHLLYDFTCHEGDVVNVVNPEGQTEWGLDEYRCTIKKVDTIITKSGHRLKRFTLQAENLEIEFGSEEEYVWIEGVGSPWEPLYPVGYWETAGGSSYLNACYVNGEQLFVGKDIYYGTGIESIHNEFVNGKSSNGKSIYDLSGRRVSASSALPKGVYVRNGRKVVMLE